MLRSRSALTIPLLLASLMVLETAAAQSAPTGAPPPPTTPATADAGNASLVDLTDAGVMSGQAGAAPAAAGPSAAPGATPAPLSSAPGSAPTPPSAAPSAAPATPAPLGVSGPSAAPVYPTPAPAPVLSAPPASAEPPPMLRADERYNALNLSVLGFLIGRVRLTYERMLTRHHGVFVEGLVAPDLLRGADFVGYGAALGYRWHWSGTGDSGFVGATIALERASGSLELRDFGGDDETYTFRGSRLGLTIAPHVGKRWVFRSGVNLTVRMGLGYAPTLSTNPSARADAKAVELVEDQLIGVDGELSVGYSF